MQDFSQNLIVDQRAKGTITILDYTQMAGKTVTVNGNVLTEGSSFNRGASNAACATALAAAINALANVDASAANNIVSIVANASGTAGNAYNLLTNGAVGALTLSGATLAGGVAKTYSSTIDFSQCGVTWDIVSQAALNGIAGSSTPTCTVSLEGSMDGKNWSPFGDTPITNDLTDTTPVRLSLYNASFVSGMTRFYRYGIVNSGVNTVADLRLNAYANA